MVYCMIGISMAANGCHGLRPGAEIALVLKYYHMEKILVAVDAAQNNGKLMEFACYIARLTHSGLTGIFLEEEVKPEISLWATYANALQMTGAENQSVVAQQYAINQEAFKWACRSAGVSHTLQTSASVGDLISESRFADLMLLDAGAWQSDDPEAEVADWVRNVLSQSECPVMVAPRSLEEIEEIIFTYDGSASAVFAIRQFTYLFPQLADRKAIVLQVSETEGEVVSGREQIGSLLKMHYSGIGFHVIQGKASTALHQYLRGRKNALVVMGAFGRNGFSGYFRPSTAELLLAQMRLPLFIAHP